MTTIYQDLYQFSSYIPPINLTFHQYLLLSDEPLLVHTGSDQQAAAMLPKLKEALNGKGLKYIFVSHFESDECGGLVRILKEFPNARTICSDATGRQLSGFGLVNEVIAKRSGDKISAGGYELEFISYPSEMHLWEGLLMMENRCGIFFSSDLMLRFGEAAGTVIESDWQSEVGNIRHEQVPDPDKRAQLQNILMGFNPKFIATGHGPCIKLL